MRRYPAYWDSGLPWLGQIPAHWDSVPLKRFVAINRSVLPEDTPPETEIRYIDIGNVDEGGLVAAPEVLNFAQAPSRARRVVHTGDAIISTVRTYLKAVAFIPESVPNLVASTGFAVLSPTSDTCAAYVSYVIQGHAFISSVSASSYGVNYPAITPNQLGNLKVAITRRREEQDAIVAFLDRELAQIDRFIANKERLIALLREQKAAIINRAVTRGLDPDVPLKPSGIAWLGDIPVHWQSARLKNLFEEVDDRSETGEETLLSLRINEGLVPHEDVSDKPVSSDQLIGYKRVTPAEIVMNRMRAASGLFAVVRASGLVSPDYAILRPRAKLDLDYFAHLFRDPQMRLVFRINSRGLGTGEAGFLRLYTDAFGRIQVPFPPMDQQIEIATFIKVESKSTEEAIERAERQIELIKEYRTTLISDAVTGKIDVRSPVPAADRVAERLAEEVPV